MAQYPGNIPKGPGKSTTSMSKDSGGARQDAKQMRQMGTQNPMQTNGSGLSQSPAINVSGDSPMSAPLNTSVGSGSRPTRSSYPIGTSAPTDAHTLNRVNGVDYLK